MEFQSPDDDTSVIKIRKEMRNFLGPSVYSTLVGTSSNNSTRKRSHSNRTSLTTDKRVDVLTSQVKIKCLESEVREMKSHVAENEIEEEKQRKLNLYKVLSSERECNETRRKFKGLIDEKETISNELMEMGELFDKHKLMHHSQLDDWNAERTRLKAELQELEVNHQQALSNQKEMFIRQSAEVVILKNKEEEMMAMITRYKKQLSEIQGYAGEYREMKHRYQSAAHEVKVLEEKLLCNKEHTNIVNNSVAELAQLQELKRENKRLREDNELYRAASDNCLIMEEQNRNLQLRLEKAEKRIEELLNLEYENEKMKRQLSEWEVTETLTNLKLPRSPLEVSRIISTLQKSQLSTIEEQEELRSKISVYESKLSLKSDELQTVNDSFSNIKEENQSLQRRCDELEKRLAVIHVEKESVERLLENYERFGNQSTLVDARKAAERDTWYKNFRENLELSIVPRSAEHKDSVVDELQEQLCRAKEEKEALEVRVKRNEIRGDFDPLKTRVLSMTDNPLRRARAKHAQTLENVRNENHALRKKVIRLKEERESSQADESMNVSTLIRRSKPVEDALKQLQVEKLKRQRLQEQFVIKAKRFREAVYNIFGFVLKETGEKMFKVTSIYADHEDQCFMFGDTGNAIVRTSYSEQWDQATKEYLMQGNSIPAFMAHTTLTLFKQQAISC